MGLAQRRRMPEGEVEATPAQGAAGPALGVGNAARCEALGLAGGGWARVGEERGGTGWFDGVDAAHGATSLTQQVDAVIPPGSGVALGARASLVVGLGGEAAVDVTVTNLGAGRLGLDCGIAAAARAGTGEAIDVGARQGVAGRRAFEVPWASLGSAPALAALATSLLPVPHEALEQLLATCVDGVDLDPYLVGESLVFEQGVGIEGQLADEAVEALVEASAATGVALSYDGVPDASGFRTGELALTVSLAGAAALGVELAAWGLSIALPSEATGTVEVAIGFAEHFATKTFTRAAVRVSSHAALGDCALDATTEAATDGGALTLAATWGLGSPLTQRVLGAAAGLGVDVGGEASVTATLTAPLPSGEDAAAIAVGLRELVTTGRVSGLGDAVAARVRAHAEALTLCVGARVAGTVAAGVDGDRAEAGLSATAFWETDDVAAALGVSFGLDEVLAAIRSGAAVA